MSDSSNSPRVSSRLSSSARLSNSISRRVHREVRFGDYILGSTLGQGEFGKVKLGWRKDGKQPEQVAIKLIRKDTVPPKSNREIKVFREINALKLLTHPNIVRLEEVIQNDKYIGIVLEYASGGELFDHILTHRYLKDNVACRLFAQLISGVHYLHSKGIVHRDLKLENLLLDKHRNVIITDFGFANSFKAASDGSIHDLMSTSCGSPCYAAPELVVSDSKYVGRKVDVWSCGVILYAMLAGYLPFDDDPANPDGDNITQLYKYITTTPLTFPEYIQPMPRDLLRKILVSDPNRRIDLKSVRSHAWLAPHAHFLSVTPVEWDRSFLRQPVLQQQELQQQYQTKQRPQSYQPHTSSAFATPSLPPTQIVPPSPATPASDYNNGIPPIGQFRTPAQTSSQVARPTTLAVPSINSTLSNFFPNPSTPTGNGPPTFPPPSIHRPSTPTGSTSRPQPMQLGVDTSYLGHARRHSVQTGYTKGVTPSSHSRGTADISQQQRRPLSTTSASSDDVLASLDSQEQDNRALYSSASYSSSRNAFSPIDENTSDNCVSPTDSLPQTPIGESMNESFSKVAISKNANAARLPPASRKPRPTSFQPSYVYSSSTSFSYVEPTKAAPLPGKPLNFHMPMSSEPRVGITPDTALPGEISRPSGLKVTAGLPVDADEELPPPPALVVDGPLSSAMSSQRVSSGEVGSTIGSRSSASPATPISNSPILPSNPGQVEIHRGRYSDDQGLPNFELSTDVDNNSLNSSNKYPSYPKRSHKRAANSVSYGADKFFGKIMGFSPPKENAVPSAIYATNGQMPPQQPAAGSRHRHTKSMLPPDILYGDGLGSISSKRSTTTTERKRFSFLGFYSGFSGTNTTPASGRATPESYRSASQSSFAVGKEDGGRRILEPPAQDRTNTINQRHKRTASIPFYTTAGGNMSVASHGTNGTAQTADREQSTSAARKVVDFFKRRSRVQ